MGGTDKVSMPSVMAQIARLTAERDLLLGAISAEDYKKIEARLVAISEKSDAELASHGETFRGDGI